MWQALSQVASGAANQFDKYYGTPATQFAWNGKDLRRNVRYQKKMMNFQNAMNRQNQIWSANSMPSETVKGLRAANLNPLLAYTDFSGLSSSGAMGVSPASVSGDNGSLGSGGLGLDYEGAFGLGMTSRQNKRKAQKVESKEIDNRDRKADLERKTIASLGEKELDNRLLRADVERDTIESTREGASALANAKQEAEMRRASADAMMEQNRGYRESLNGWLLAREMTATTGKAFASHADHMSTAEMQEFWNDYYREKMDADKWKNSAKRAYIMDGLDGAKQILDMAQTGADAYGGLKGKGKAKPKAPKSHRRRRH